MPCISLGLFERRPAVPVDAEIAPAGTEKPHRARRSHLFVVQVQTHSRELQSTELTNPTIGSGEPAGPMSWTDRPLTIATRSTK